MTDAMKYRKSRQRERILDILHATKAHPTADTIYIELKNEFPDLSLGNVYRNLNILMDQGLIQRLDFGSTFNRFDGNPHIHSHFICEKCGSVSDLEIDFKDQAEIAGLADKSGLRKINRYKLDFYGICEKCIH